MTGTARADWQSAVNLARTLTEQGRYEAALDAWREALAHAERFGPADARLAATWTNLGSAHYDVGQYREAERAFRQSLAIWEVALGKDHPGLAPSLNNLAAVYTQLGRYSQAELHLARARRILQSQQPPDSARLWSIANNLCEVYFHLGRYADADRLAREALSLVKPNSLERATVLVNLGVVMAARGKPREAEPPLLEAIRIWNEHKTSSHPGLAEAQANLASVCAAQKRWTQALALFRESLPRIEAAWGPEHPKVGRFLLGYAGVLRRTKAKSEASRVQSRAKAILERAALQGRHAVDVRALR